MSSCRLSRAGSTGSFQSADRIATMKNNTCCVESPSGNKQCGNLGGGNGDKPLCAACELICGTEDYQGQPSKWQSLTHENNPQCQCGNCEWKNSGLWLCEYCKPSRPGGHYQPHSSLTAWHSGGNAIHCTCTICKIGGGILAKPTTQKARGVMAVRDWHINDSYAMTHISTQLWDQAAAEASLLFGNCSTSAIVQRIVGLARESRNNLSSMSGLIDNGSSTSVLKYKPTLPTDITGCVFVRPCPVRPRHGFVDSRCVTVPMKVGHESAKQMINEIIAIYHEATANDPKAELLLMPYMPAQFNLVVTPSQVTVGPGNDGATSGHDTITLPVTEVDASFPAHLLLAADIKDYPYFEAVTYNTYYRPIKNGDDEMGQAQSWRQQTFLTQLRDGPKPRGGRLGKNFIPEKITVKKVIAARGSLLEWEAQMAKAANKKAGLVVWHPKGSLTSHYAVHCIQNNIPIVTDSDEPKIGAVLQPSGTQLINNSSVNRKAMIQGIYEGLNTNGAAIWPSESVTLMLYALHNAPSMDLSDEAMCRILGYSFGTSVILGAIACIGELRHGDSDPNHQLGAISSATGGGRESAYQKWLHKVFEATWEDFTHRYVIFAYTGWSGAIGGIRWYECAEAALGLWNEICAFVNDESADHKPMLAALNRVVNVCHNGAKMLTKFIGHNVKAFDLASTQPMISALLAGPTAHRVANMPVIKYKPIDFTAVKVLSFEEMRAEINKRRIAAGAKAKLCCRKCKYENEATASKCANCDRAI
jgi:hypothetical protein